MYFYPPPPRVFVNCCYSFANCQQTFRKGVCLVTVTDGELYEIIDNGPGGSSLITLSVPVRKARTLPRALQS